MTTTAKMFTQECWCPHKCRICNSTKVKCDSPLLYITLNINSLFDLTHNLAKITLTIKRNFILDTILNTGKSRINSV